MSDDTTTDDNTEEEKRGEREFRVLPVMFDVGFSIAVPLVLFAFLGRFLDDRFDTSPLLLVAGVALSAIVSSVIVWKKMKDYL